MKVAEKENAVKKNETEIKLVYSGIYHEEGNDSANSQLTFSIAELDDFNVGKYFAVYWPKPKASYRGKFLKVFSADVDGDATEGIGQQLKIRALLMLSYVLQVHVSQISLIPVVQNLLLHSC